MAPEFMEVPHRECLPDRLLRPRVQPLTPNTPGSIALREQVQQIAVGRPGRKEVLFRAAADRDPCCPAAAAPVESIHENLPAVLMIPDAERDPFPRGREPDRLQIGF